MPCAKTNLTDDVFEEAFSDMLRQMMLLVALPGTVLLLAPWRPKRSREADIMVALLSVFQVVVLALGVDGGSGIGSGRVRSSDVGRCWQKRG
mmetsp:Transcript_22270/g.39663  ORF Transcript_22270/g.39663 Transcript_22270/m.39663 type:complete len:92 (-) Transcript_22270:63-338(-)